MLQITAKHKIFVATSAIDFRCGIDRLTGYCRCQLQLNPMSGHVFIFRNRKCNALKLLIYDSQGFWLAHKRLSSGKFNHWPSSSHQVIMLDIPQLHALLYNANPQLIDAPVFKPLDDN